MIKIYTVILVTLYTITGCKDSGKQISERSNTATDTSLNETVASGGISDESDSVSLSTSSAQEWSANKKLPEVSLPEFEGTAIKYYEGNGFSVYSIAKELLFTTGSAGLRAGAEQNLRKISSSITQRNNKGQVRIFAYIDVSENPNYKRDVAKRRVETIKEWLQTNGNIDASRVFVQPVIDIDPEKADSPDISKEQRIEIVIRNMRT